MKRYALVAATGALAVAVSVLSAGTAQAADRVCGAVEPGTISDPIPIGATGGVDEGFSSRTQLTDVDLHVTDTLADGHHVGVRLVTTRPDGSLHYWTWHELFAGNGSSQAWHTTATDSAGIQRVQAEVAVMEGSSIVGHCTTSAEDNPFYE